MECGFCRISSGEIRPRMVYEDQYVMAFLDSDPDNEGHVIVITRQHYHDIDEIPSDILGIMIDLTGKIVAQIKKLYAPDGYTVMHNGGAFNETDHFHFHIFPRFDDDGFGWTCTNECFAVSDEIALKIHEGLFPEVEEAEDPEADDAVKSETNQE